MSGKYLPQLFYKSVELYIEYKDKDIQKGAINMKTFIPIIMIITMVLVASCDSPRSQRANNTNSNLSIPGGSNGFSTSGNITSIDLNNNNPSTTTTTSTTGTSFIVPDDAKCKFASDGITGFDLTNSYIGQYTLCQSSSSDKTIFYFQLKTPPTDNNSNSVSICFIPTTSSGTNSIPVGNAMCGNFSDPKSIRKITFVKFSQYSNSTIDGVIFFKDLKWLYPTFYNFNYVSGRPQYFPIYNNYINTLDAYKLCMSMLSDINSSLNCTYFKNAGQYVYQKFGI